MKANLIRLIPVLLLTGCFEKINVTEPQLKQVLTVCQSNGGIDGEISLYGKKEGDDSSPAKFNSAVAKCKNGRVEEMRNWRTRGD